MTDDDSALHSSRRHHTLTALLGVGWAQVSWSGRERFPHHIHSEGASWLPSSSSLSVVRSRKFSFMQRLPLRCLTHKDTTGMLLDAKNSIKRPSGSYYYNLLPARRQRASVLACTLVLKLLDAGLAGDSHFRVGPQLRLLGWQRHCKRAGMCFSLGKEKTQFCSTSEWKRGLQVAPVLKSGRRRQRGAVFQEGLGVSFSFIMERSFYFSHRVSHPMLRVLGFASALAWWCVKIMWRKSNYYCLDRPKIFRTKNYEEHTGFFSQKSLKMHHKLRTITNYRSQIQ